MKIKIWGCRRALPTPGPGTVKYGGNTTCVEVRLADGSLLNIDSGSGIRKLGNELIKEPAGREMYLVLKQKLGGSAYSIMIPTIRTSK